MLTKAAPLTTAVLNTAPNPRTHIESLASPELVICLSIILLALRLSLLAAFQDVFIHKGVSSSMDSLIGKHLLVLNSILVPPCLHKHLRKQAWEQLAFIEWTVSSVGTYLGSHLCVRSGVQTTNLCQSIIKIKTMHYRDSSTVFAKE